MPLPPPPLLRRLRFAALAGLCLALPAAVLRGADTDLKSFNIPAGDAANSLRQFAQQSGVELLYSPKDIAGAKTNPVQGKLPPRAALDQLLRGTELMVAQGKNNGALGVTRAPDPNAPGATPSTDSVRPNPTAKDTAAPEEAPIELSPFTVNADKDAGYVANSSLAGSRVNTPLRDTAASITVMTSEFLSDIGAIDLTEAMQWANNVQMDVIDTQNNPNDNASILGFPSFRVRGIPADVTRNYFTWRLSTDSYNVDRIEEQRGPNSILFGIGSAGGILNSTTKRANLGRDFVRVSLQAGSYESYRGSIDVNQRAFDGRLGIRFNGVFSHQGAFRYHAFNETRRVHLAATFLATKRTTLRAEYETGDLDQVTSRTGNGYDEITRWLDAGRPTIPTAIPANAANNATLTALGLANYGTAARVTWIGNTGQLFDLRNRNVSAGRSSIIQDSDLIDRRVNTGGPGQKRYGNFNTVSVYLEQRLWERTHFELAYNHLEDRFTAYIAGQGTTENTRLRADPHQFLPNGQPNPFAGRLMFEGARWNRSITERRSDNTRLTVSHEQDFGKWGNYRVAALGEYEWRANKNRNQVEAWADRAFATASQGIEAGPNLVYRRNYVVEGDWQTYYINGPAETGLIQGLVDPVSGRTLSSTWVNFNANVNDNPEYQKDFQVGMQARWFQNRLVAGFGWRKDELDLTKRVGRRAATTNGTPGEFGQFYDNATYETYSASTRTAGIVAHLPWNVSAFYNISNSFGLPNTNIRILPDGDLPPNPEAIGTDYGLAFVFYGGRINARINRFVNDLTKAQFEGFGGSVDNPTALARSVLTSFLNNGIINQAEYDARDPDTNGAIGDRRVEGYELTLTANVTKNWRLVANYSYTEGYDSNSAPEVKAWAETEIPYFMRYPDLLIGDGRTVAQAVADWQARAQSYWDLEGLTLLGNRRQKVSLFTRYNLPGQMLRGAYIGGGYRHVGKSELGITPTLEIRHGNSYWLADFLAGYRIAKLPLVNRPLTLQLNVTNLFDWDTPITTRFNTDGTINRWNVLEPRTWRLNATMDF